MPSVCQQLLPRKISGEGISSSRNDGIQTKRLSLMRSSVFSRSQKHTKCCLTPSEDVRMMHMGDKVQGRISLMPRSFSLHSSMQTFLSHSLDNCGLLKRSAKIF